MSGFVPDRARLDRRDAPADRGACNRRHLTLSLATALCGNARPERSLPPPMPRPTVPRRARDGAGGEGSFDE